MKIPVRAAVLASVVASVLAAVPALQAQDSGEGFLFQRPSGSFALRGGYAMPSANSDIFTFTSNNFTMNRGDFSTIDYGMELSFALSPRVDLSFDVAHNEVTKGTEYRNFVDNNNQPIQQSTGFQRTPVTMNVRYYLMDRGRQIGHYAWVPTNLVPYVGAGVGMMYYEFTQKGDFIDDSTNAVFSDQFHSGGWASMGQALAGVDWSLGSRWALRTEARYLVASAALSSDFIGFHRIDLSGLTTNVGFFVRF